jgi:hypothetical protein
LYKGTWQFCTSYNQGDTAVHDGHLWEATQQSAGKEPGTPDGTLFWNGLGVFAPAGSVRHDDTTEKSTTKEGEYNHISDDEADAVLNAKQPSAANPFITASQVPELALRLGVFGKIPMPAGLGMIYGAHFDALSNLLAVAGDGVLAWRDANAGTWEVQALAGEWRGITKHSGVWVAVGENAIAAGAAGSLAIAATVAGGWKDAASSGGAVVAVADGRTALSSDGLTGWTARDEAPGYGNAVAYNDAEGKFFSVGKAGCLVSSDGETWANDAAMPAGTWRDIARGQECMFALSGRSAHRPDGENWILDDAMPIGGWEAGANGGGFNLAVGSGIAALSGERAHSYTMKDIPNYVYTSAVHGAGRFWALGSAIVSAAVTDIAGALEAIEGANEDNRIATAQDVSSAAEAAAADLESARNELENAIQAASETLEALAGRVTALEEAVADGEIILDGGTV